MITNFRKQHQTHTWAFKEKLLVEDMWYHMPQLSHPDLVQVGTDTAAHCLPVQG